MRRVLQSAAQQALFSQSVGSPIGPDEFFSSVVLLLDFAGVDGATDITDLSNSGHVDTFVGNAEIDTGLPYLGVNSLLCNGLADGVTFPDSADWDYGTGDFTVELGYLTEVEAQNAILLSRFEAGGFSLQHNGTTNNIHVYVGTSIRASLSDFIAEINQYYHIAVTRSGTDLRLFVDGVISATVTNSEDITGGSLPLNVGRLSSGGSAVNGNIGAVRITKGVARYTANFTPPTEFYPTS